MKKHTLILVLVILSAFLLLIAYSNEKQNSKNADAADISIVKTGKYFGVPYKLTSSFMPVLTLEDSGGFKLELGIGKSIEGTYRVDDNKLFLTYSSGDENYILNVSNNILVIEQEIPNYIKKGTNFKLAEKE